METTKRMPRVIIESPYAGDVAMNLRYVRAAMRDCLKRGEAPFASHALYTQPGVLDDAVQEERDLGISAGFAWWDGATVIAYVDLGVSPGMLTAIHAAHARGIYGGERNLGEGWDSMRFQDSHMTELNYNPDRDRVLLFTGERLTDEKLNQLRDQWKKAFTGPAKKAIIFDAGINLAILHGPEIAAKAADSFGHADGEQHEEGRP